jgi:hypothetical protein
MRENETRRARIARRARSDKLTGSDIYLKKVIAIGPIEFTAQHTAALEISGQTRTGTGRCDHPLRDHRV